MTEALAEMRAGRIDIINGVPPVQAQAMKQTNPDILQIPGGMTPPPSVEMRLDMAPFNDIRVRQAMQMAIDLPGIAKT
jgi:ABC-type transport system substrate-binding protein